MRCDSDGLFQPNVDVSRCSAILTSEFGGKGGNSRDLIAGGVEAPVQRSFAERIGSLDADHDDFRPVDFSLASRAGPIGSDRPVASLPRFDHLEVAEFPLFSGGTLVSNLEIQRTWFVVANVNYRAALGQIE